MRTFFNIVLEILLTVAKTCVHALASAAGALTLAAAVLFVGIYAFRRQFRPKAHLTRPAGVISIER